MLGARATALGSGVRRDPDRCSICSRPALIALVCTAPSRPATRERRAHAHVGGRVAHVRRPTADRGGAPGSQGALRAATARRGRASRRPAISTACRSRSPRQWESPASSRSRSSSDRCSSPREWDSRAEIRRGRSVRGYALGVLAALVGFLVAGLFEWNFGDEELLYLLYVSVGIAWGARRWDRAARERGDASGAAGLRRRRASRDRCRREGRARPRLAHRHARRRAHARATVRALPRRSDLHAACGSGAPCLAAIESHPIHTSFVQSLPAATRRYRWYLPLFPRAIERFRLDGFDAVVSSSHCVAKGVACLPRRST